MFPRRQRPPGRVPSEPHRLGSNCKPERTRQALKPSLTPIQHAAFKAHCDALLFAAAVGLITGCCVGSNLHVEYQLLIVTLAVLLLGAHITHNYQRTRRTAIFELYVVLRKIYQYKVGNIALMTR